MTADAYMRNVGVPSVVQLFLLLPRVLGRVAFADTSGSRALVGYLSHRVSFGTRRACIEILAAYEATVCTAGMCTQLQVEAKCWTTVPKR